MYHLLELILHTLSGFGVQRHDEDSHGYLWIVRCAHRGPRQIRIKPTDRKFSMDFSQLPAESSGCVD